MHVRLSRPRSFIPWPETAAAASISELYLRYRAPLSLTQSCPTGKGELLVHRYSHSWVCMCVQRLLHATLSSVTLALHVGTKWAGYDEPVAHAAAWKAAFLAGGAMLVLGTSAGSWTLLCIRFLVAVSHYSTQAAQAAAAHFLAAGCAAAGRFAWVAQRLLACAHCRVPDKISWYRLLGPCRVPWWCLSCGHCMLSLCVLRPVFVAKEGMPARKCRCRATACPCLEQKMLCCHGTAVRSDHPQTHRPAQQNTLHHA